MSKILRIMYFILRICMCIDVYMYIYIYIYTYMYNYVKLSDQPRSPKLRFIAPPGKKTR